MTVTLQQFQVLLVEDVQGVLETGGVSRLGHLLHQLWGKRRVIAVISIVPRFLLPTPFPALAALSTSWLCMEEHSGVGERYLF